MHWPWIIGAAALFSLAAVDAVKASDFKRCDQSGFCTRHRAHAEWTDAAAQGQRPPLSSYRLKDVKFAADQGTLEASLVTAESSLRLTLATLADGMLRVRITEPNGLYPRYEVADVLMPSASQTVPFQVQSEGSVHRLAFGSALAVLHTDPWQMNVYRNDIPVAILNQRGYFKYEWSRAKPADNMADVANDTDSAAVDGVDDVQQRLIKDEWEETFNGFTDTKRYGPMSVGMDVTFPDAHHVYGLPEHASDLALKSTRGGGQAYAEPFRLYNLDVFEYDLNRNAALYGAVPFVMAHKTVGTRSATAGFFWLNAAETWIDVERHDATPALAMQTQSADHQKKSPSTLLHWMSESGIIDLFVLTGPNPADVMRQYAKLTGSQNLPQYFSLGYHQCRWNYMDTSEVHEVMQGFEQHEIPMDVIWLDIEHTNDKRYFTWHPTKFLDPVTMQQSVAKYGRKMVTIIDPHIKRDDAYHVKKMASEKQLFVRNKDGQEYDGWCWPGSSSWIDYTSLDARKFWIALFDYSVYQGSTEHLFTWNDMNEPSVFNGPEITMPKDNVHAGGWEHRDVHNIYGAMQHRSTYGAHIARSMGSGQWKAAELPSTTPSRPSGPTPHRPFVLSRAFFAGTQRYGAMWTGDNMAKWDHLAAAAPMLLSASLAGIGFCGADVGGFFFNPEPELLTRWYQAGAFYPFFRGHAHLDTKRREPWVFGDPYTGIIKEAIQTRYRLLPYWYTLFRRGQLEGSTPIRPLFVEFPMDRETFGVEDQYMIGASLMVKPVVMPVSEGGNTVSVYLPGQQPWFNYYNFLAYGAGGEQRLKTFDTSSLATPLPTLVRAGSVVPTRQRLRRSSALTHQDPVTLIVALDSNWKADGDLYLDDGESFAYALQGHFIHRQFGVSGTPGKSLRIQSSAFGASEKDFSAWQQPFLGDAVTTTPLMTLKADAGFGANVGSKVVIDQVWIVGLADGSKVATRTPSVRIVSPNAMAVEKQNVILSTVTSSKLYGVESAGQNGVAASFKLDLVRLNLAVNADWLLEVTFE